ncbi:hypothetical protein NAC44_03675 [Allorhizobium sp. BGMRC 0089]|uniref:hypothetical protein n=1 Tax=Allorhizobium sonneratiae TaxID=2934936 RepID=UPI00203411B2|nr:hypothetical protein [Allorhizobium sonneratiae]MCM2291427.1 hypothetical protein [Allorhizobium sonneratiae]
MIDLLLLGIIIANPIEKGKTKDVTRLARARAALFGDENKQGQKSTHNPVLLFPIIAEALKADRDQMMRFLKSVQKQEIQVEWDAKLAEAEPSFRGLAKKYAPDFAKAMTSMTSTEDWLRRAIDDIPVTEQDMADLEGLFHGDSPKAERLKRIFDDLNGLGIACENPIGTKTTDITPERG